MNPILKKQVERRLERLNFENMVPPSAETIQALLQDGIPQYKDSMPPDHYFEWAWSQYALFGPASFNAVEIAAMTGIRGEIVAAYISTYGSDWAEKLLWRHRKTTDFGLIKVGRAYWSRTMLEFFSKSMKPKTRNQDVAKKWSASPSKADLTSHTVMAIYTMTEAIVPLYLFNVPKYLEDGSDTSKTMRPVVRYKGFDISGEDQIVQAYGVDF